MIIIKLNNREFEQDIRPLVLSFYPGAVLLVLDDEAKEADAGQKEPRTDADLLLRIFQTETNVSISLYEAPDAAEPVLKREETFPVPGPLPGEEYRITRKNQLKRDLYRFLSACTGRALPWGTLTGIRPVKLVTAMLQEGLSEDAICARLETDYYMSGKKQELALRTAKNEDRLIRSLEGLKSFSLYVSIPFCPSTCAYCSFTSYPLAKWAGEMDRYLQCVEKELDLIADQTAGKKPETIYIGGGTPTTLLPAQMERLLSGIAARFDLSGLKEWTVEAGRPDSITEEKLAAIRGFPVSRISVNPQTMKDETLRLIGRKHTTAQTLEAFACARRLGFDNINMDIIAGLPGETPADFQNTVEQIRRLDPESLTVHTLARKRAARLNTNAEEFAAFARGDTDAMLEAAYAGARNMGMEPYYLYRQKNMAGNLENTGYAKEGKFGIYNILIMEEIQSIYAAGAGGSSKLVFADGRHERIENVKDVGHYIARIDEMMERKILGGRL